VYLFLFDLSIPVYGLLPPSDNSIAVSNSNNNSNNNNNNNNTTTQEEVNAERVSAAHIQKLAISPFSYRYLLPTDRSNVLM
jgi:hypothetical protein